MKIKLLTTMAGPEGCFKAETVLNVPEERALELVAGRYAVSLDPLPFATGRPAIEPKAEPKPEPKAEPVEYEDEPTPRTGRRR